MLIRPNFLSLKLFGNSWGFLYIPFLLLIITLRFTCGQKKIWSNIRKSQIILTMNVSLYCTFLIPVFRWNLLYTGQSFCLNLDNQQRNWEIIFENKSIWSCVRDEWVHLHTVFQWNVSKEHGWAILNRTTC